VPLVKFAYADPPYIGCAKLYPEKTEVDHVALIARLVDEYPDGWALSCSSPSLQQILAMCPTTVRVMAWVKPFAVFKQNVGLAYAWEPVVFSGGRKITREQPTVRDWVAVNITLRKGLTGAKPEAFCQWILSALNFQDGDTLDDLYPGTGIMAECTKQLRLAMTSIPREGRDE
jgi:hypothetical protein